MNPPTHPRASVKQWNTRNPTATLSGVIVCTPPGSGDNDQSLYWSLCDTLQTDKQHNDDVYRTQPDLAAAHIEQWLMPGGPVFVAQTSQTDTFPFFRALHLLAESRAEAEADRAQQVAAGVTEALQAGKLVTDVVQAFRSRPLRNPLPGPVKPVRIIALYDDPLLAALDDFFTHVEQHTGRTRAQLAHTRTQALIAAFLQSAQLSGKDRHAAWIESLAQTLDAPLYQEAAVSRSADDRGWHTLGSQTFDGVRILLLDRRRLTENVGTISDFLGLPRGTFRLRQYPTLNEENREFLAPLRQRFMERFQYPRELARAMYDSRFCRHYGHRLAHAPVFVEPASAAAVRERSEYKEHSRIASATTTTLAGTQ